ncbi:MAG: hypothetical protein K5773_03645 [Pseudobutyrivibrio sp.]|nr:hypothetical protein [Pseudobutyrivibrio sp.]
MKKKTLALLICLAFLCTGCNTSEIEEVMVETTQTSDENVNDKSETSADSDTSKEEAESDAENESDAEDENSAENHGASMEDQEGDLFASEVQFEVANPTFSKFNNTGLDSTNYSHITLTETKKYQQDWLDTSVWAEKNGFTLAGFPYSDERYSYVTANPMDPYSSTVLYATDRLTGTAYTFNLYPLCFGPSEDGDYSAVTQHISWAKIQDDILYVSLVHLGYSSEEPHSSHMLAIDIADGTVLWRSEALVANGYNFQILDDTIICGYGFTAEPDFIYLLDKHTGDKVGQYEVVSAPYQFEIVGDTLYVATYNTSYEFTINK